VLTEQLQATVNSTDDKDQISVLLEKQQHLISKLRDAEKNALGITRERIQVHQGRMRAELIQSMLPESLTGEALLPALDKIQMLNSTKHKAMFLCRQICENFLENAERVHDEPDQRNQYIQSLLNICMHCHRMIHSASTVQFQVANMTPGQYDEITKLLVWDQVRNASRELDTIMNLLMEESLGYNFDTSSLEQAIQ